MRYQHAAEMRADLRRLKRDAGASRSEAVASSPAPPGARTSSRSWPALGLSAALVFLASAVGWFWWHEKPAKTAERSPTRLTSNGVSTSPAISPDGKMLAYLSSVGVPTADIWVQQVGGSNAIQITHENEGASSPVFSLDGMQIAYVSRGDIYEVSALGGEPRLIARDGSGPLYASEGSAIMFVRAEQGSNRLFRVPRVEELLLRSRPGRAWTTVTLPFAPPMAPSFSRYCPETGEGSRISGRGGLSPSPEESLRVDLPHHSHYCPVKSELRIHLPGRCLTRIPASNGSLGESNGDTYNLFRVAVADDRRLTSDPEQLTFITGFASNASVSESGRMVFASGIGRTNLWKYPYRHRSCAGNRRASELDWVEGIRDDLPSLSRDGRKVAFFSDRRLIVKDLGTGRETQLAQDVFVERGTRPSISPDGSFVAYYAWNLAKTEMDLYLISATGRAPRRACRDCGTPKGFSSDGRRVLTQMGSYGPGRARIVPAMSPRVTWQSC